MKFVTILMLMMSVALFAQTPRNYQEYLSIVTHLRNSQIEHKRLTNIKSINLVEKKEAIVSKYKLLRNEAINKIDIDDVNAISEIEKINNKITLIKMSGVSSSANDLKIKRLRKRKEELENFDSKSIEMLEVQEAKELDELEELYNQLEEADKVSDSHDTKIKNITIDFVSNNSKLDFVTCELILKGKGTLLSRKTATKVTLICLEKFKSDYEQYYGNEQIAEIFISAIDGYSESISLKKLSSIILDKKTFKPNLDICMGLLEGKESRLRINYYSVRSDSILDIAKICTSTLNRLKLTKKDNAYYCKSIALLAQINKDYQELINNCDPAGTRFDYISNFNGCIKFHYELYLETKQTLISTVNRKVYSQCTNMYDAPKWTEKYDIEDGEIKDFLLDKYNIFINFK